ncbi:MAG TPA: bifunctional precorrin-2 dehydrogenase/sirohydrochlorin ferrochelatase [Actinomycetota bacterium]|jgi:precorrin-2 dehydrogenase/sirohydrochlorin ferrochelatase|nr:bifunctional precorrin-2 dehydrogenase/sirohydrochlorin ferrochelatase [Actinomycetota bacterium]
MPFGYPVSLELSGRKAVVIGEDAVAQGKVGPLVAVGAEVTVVADGPPGVLDRLEREGRVTVLRRGFRPQDLEGAFICVASSRDPEVRIAIHREGRVRGVLVNVMDDPDHCDFAAPAVVRREDLVLAISTGGRSPALARRLRVELEQRFGPMWGVLLELVGEVREETLHLLPDLRERSRRWQAALDLEELERLVGAGRLEEARNRLRSRLLEVGSV